MKTKDTQFRTCPICKTSTTETGRTTKDGRVILHCGCVVFKTVSARMHVRYLNKK